jgi:hypothetical protein
VYTIPYSADSGSLLTLDAVDQSCDQTFQLLHTLLKLSIVSTAERFCRNTEMMIQSITM